jgi:hypothetical protein
MRLVDYRRLPLPEAFQRLLAVWRAATTFYRGPGPLGVTELPLECLLADWLQYEHPEAERCLHECLEDESIYIKAYCLHTLLALGSLLLLQLPACVTCCSEVITRCHGCSIVRAPLWKLFEEEVQSVRLMFEGE